MFKCVCVQQNLINTQRETKKFSNTEGTSTIPLLITVDRVEMKEEWTHGRRGRQRKREKDETEGRR